MIKRLYLFRHANSTKNLERRHGNSQKPREWTITPESLALSENYFSKLSNFIQFDLIYCSNSRPSIQTAEILSKYQKKPCIVLSELQSINLGVISGLSESEVENNFPDINERMNLYHKGFLHPSEYAIPGSEKNLEFETRIRKAISTITENSYQNICIVAHRSTITMALNIASNWPNNTDKGTYEVININPLSLSVINIIEDGSKWEIAAVSQGHDEIDLQNLFSTENFRDKNLQGENSNIYTLGINFSTHDTSACLLRGESIVAAVEEEKLNRQKQTSEFPLKSIDYCLRENNVSWKDINTIALPIDKQEYEEVFPKILNSAPNNSREQLKFATNVHLSVEIPHLLKTLGLPEEFKNKFRFYKHHLAHAASAYYLSGFNKASILIIDGVGEVDTITIFHGNNEKIEFIQGSKFPNSLGKLYGAVCRYLGFTGYSKEGKVMGLASYGNPMYLEKFRDLASWDNGLPVLNTEYINFGITPLQPSVVSNKFIQTFGAPRENGQQITQHHKNIASSLQSFLEEAIIEIGKHTLNLLGETSLCYSGGVALNCLANRSLRESNLFEKIFIPPAPNDSGLSIGAAYLAANEKGRTDAVFHNKLEHAYLGPKYNEKDIILAANSYELKPQKLSSPARVAAELLADGKIIGWFQGKLEFGPRALGNRSILADPRNYQVKEVLNNIIKERETFRPFAPAILEEKASEVFECNKDSPYMLDVFNVRPEWKNKIPAVIHIDGAARLQTVTAKSNFVFYQVLRWFFDFTNTPVILNTSLNGRDEPIVDNPVNALKLFTKSALSYMIINNYLFSKNN